MAEGEEELIDLIDAAAESGHLKKDDVAHLLGVTSNQLTNMQKKLRYRRARPHEHGVAKKPERGDNAKK